MRPHPKPESEAPGAGTNHPRSSHRDPEGHLDYRDGPGTVLELVSSGMNTKQDHAKILNLPEVMDPLETKGPSPQKCIYTALSKIFT